VGAKTNSEGFRDSFLRNGRKTQGAKMAGKKDAKQKAGPCGRTEKNKEKTKSSAGTNSASGGSRQRTAQRTQRQPLQEQEEERLGRGAQGQVEAEGEDIQEGWKAIKEIDKVLGHLEGRLDRMTAVIRRASMQDRTPEPATPGEGVSQKGSRGSLEEMEVPALGSSLGEHRIVDVEPRAEGPRVEIPRAEENSALDSVESGSRGEEKKKECRWKTKGDGPRKSTIRPKA
jgi:hypothetical protein